MSKLEERIAATEQRLKALKAQHARSVTRQRARDAKQNRQDTLRRKILVGAVVLELVERGEIEAQVLVKWLKGALVREEDWVLFSGYWDATKGSGAGISGDARGSSRSAVEAIGAGRVEREGGARG